MNLHLVDFDCFRMLQFQYFSSTARFSDSTYIDAKIVVFHLFCNCTIWKHRKSTESEKREWELRNIKPAPKSFEMYSKSFAEYFIFSFADDEEFKSTCPCGWSHRTETSQVSFPRETLSKAQQTQGIECSDSFNPLNSKQKLQQAWKPWSSVRLGFEIL